MPVSRCNQSLTPRQRRSIVGLPLVSTGLVWRRILWSYR